MQIKEFTEQRKRCQQYFLKISRTFLLVKLSLQKKFPAASSTIDIAKLIIIIKYKKKKRKKKKLHYIV
jgi:hypothetical protein